MRIIMALFFKEINCCKMFYFCMYVELEEMIGYR